MRKTRVVTRAFCPKTKRPAILVSRCRPRSVNIHQRAFEPTLPREPLLLDALRRVDICKGASAPCLLRNPSRSEAHLQVVNICHGASDLKVMCNVGPRFRECKRRSQFFLRVEKEF